MIALNSYLYTLQIFSLFAGIATSSLKDPCKLLVASGKFSKLLFTLFTVFGTPSFSFFLYPSSFFVVLGSQSADRSTLLILQKSTASNFTITWNRINIFDLFNLKLYLHYWFKMLAFSKTSNISFWSSWYITIPSTWSWKRNGGQKYFPFFSHLMQTGANIPSLQNSTSLNIVTSHFAHFFRLIRHAWRRTAHNLNIIKTELV